MTKPLQRISHSFLDEGRASKLPLPKEKGAALERIVRAIAGLPNPTQKGALLPTALAPSVVVHLLAAFAQPRKVARPERSFTFSEEEIFSSKKKTALDRQPQKQGPIGLRRLSSYTWVNALMQLLLFLPEFPDAVSFLPRSLEAFRSFVERYRFDQQQGRAVSEANHAALIGCLKDKLSQQFFRYPEWVDLYAVFVGICELISLRYETKVVWDVGSGLSLQQLAHKKLEQKPPELLVALRGVKHHNCCPIQRQFFTSPDWLCYDLDAFVECRPDGQAEAEYITYIKSEGIWHQCDHERVTAMRSSALTTSLQRSILLHYRRISLTP
jgi:hypothetical protein